MDADEGCRIVGKITGRIPFWKHFGCLQVLNFIFRWYLDFDFYTVVWRRKLQKLLCRLKDAVESALDWRKFEMFWILGLPKIQGHHGLWVSSSRHRTEPIRLSRPLSRTESSLFNILSNSFHSNMHGQGSQRNLFIDKVSEFLKSGSPNSAN
jgi:hypothetical protein